MPLLLTSSRPLRGGGGLWWRRAQRHRTHPPTTMRIGHACCWLLAAALALGATDQAWAGPIGATSSSHDNSKRTTGAGGLNVLTSVGGQLSVDLTVAPWEQVRVGVRGVWGLEDRIAWS